VRAFYCDEFILPLPDGHRFPMEKYRLLRESLLAAGVLGPADLAVPPAASDAELATAHDPGYVARVVAGTLERAEVRRIGFPWSPALVERCRRSVGGTLAACRAALEDGVAANLAGGTHHAFADRGEGYCVWNDVAVALRVLLGEGRIERAAVLDLDVHQGNGTAALFAAEPRVFTLSLHGRHNFPFHKETSDLDCELPDGCGDDEYLATLEHGLVAALEPRPDLAVYLAGADPFEGDRLGRLGLSKAGLLARDRAVLDACARAGVPLAIVMAGGYAHDVSDTVAIHHATLALAASFAHTSLARSVTLAR
jgi:acetoin utilization deacetylase AcuC-like enzyme